MSNWSNDPNWRDGYAGYQNSTTNADASWAHEQGRLARAAEEDARFRAAWNTSPSTQPSSYATTNSYESDWNSNPQQPSSGGGEGLGILLLVLIGPLPVVGPGGFAGYELRNLLLATGWHNLYAWIAAAVLFGMVTLLMMLFYARLPAKASMVLGGLLCAGGGWLLATSGWKLSMHWAGAVALVGAAIGAGWFYAIASACKGMLGDRSIDFSANGRARYVLAGYLALLPPAALVAGAAYAGRGIAAVSLILLALTATLVLFFYSHRHASASISAGHASAGFAMLPVAMITGFAAAWGLALAGVISAHYVIGAPPPEGRSTEFFLLGSAALGFVAPLAIAAHATITSLPPKSLGSGLATSVVWALLAFAGYFGYAALDRYEAPLTAAEIEVLKAERATAERDYAEREKAAQEAIPQLIALMRKHLAISPGETDGAVPPVYAALSTLAKERKIEKHASQFIHRQRIFWEMIGKQGWEKTPSASLTSDYQTQLDELSTLVERLGGFRALEADLAQRDGTEAGALLDALKSRPLLDRLIRLARNELPPLGRKELAAVYERLAPKLLAYAPDKAEFHSERMGQILAIAIAKNDVTAIGSWHYINRQFAAMPDGALRGETEQKEYVYNTAEALVGLAGYLDREGVAPGQSEFLKAVAAEVSAEMRPLCRDLVAARRRGGSC